MSGCHCKAELLPSALSVLEALLHPPALRRLLCLKGRTGGGVESDQEPEASSSFHRQHGESCEG